MEVCQCLAMKTNEMNTTKHTPGTWAWNECSDGYEITAGNYRVAHVGESVRFSTVEPIANTKRIVACVNALSGMEPGAVADVVKALDGLLNLRFREWAARYSQSDIAMLKSKTPEVAAAIAALAALKGGAK